MYIVCPEASTVENLDGAGARQAWRRPAQLSQTITFQRLQTPGSRLLGLRHADQGSHR
jgi:hypothetical protein